MLRPRLVIRRAEWHLEQQETETWQFLSHRRLEEALQVEVEGYVSVSVDRPEGKSPIVIRELPETVGGKVWRGAWLLWKALNLYGLDGASDILELGAGVGLVGLLLAADLGVSVALSETSTAYSGAEVTWENLLYNVQMNQAQIGQVGGHVEALEVDWTKGLTGQRFDLVIGSDILYEPHLFEDLLDVMQEAAPKAVLVQNLARKGTEYFLELCKKRHISVRSVDVSDLDADEMDGIADSRDGTYHCWFLDFTQAIVK
eukprot:Skav224448  [mRNA]  locus=scaffold3858:12349:13422:+ [translate_table: standard]